jgi:hypothetical protein
MSSVLQSLELSSGALLEMSFLREMTHSSFIALQFTQNFCDPANLIYGYFLANSSMDDFFWLDCCLKGIVSRDGVSTKTIGV